MISITLYEGATRPEPSRVDTFDSWDEWADALEHLVGLSTGARPTASREEQKRALWAWAPHALREPYRALENVESVTALALDVDAVPNADVDALVTRASTLSPLGGIVYESPSSTVEAPRVRLCLPLAKPHIPEHTRHMRIVVAELLGLDPNSGVAGALDASRVFFAGRLHGTTARKVWRW